MAAYPGVIGLFLLDSDVLETNPTKRDVGTPISLAAPFMLNHHNVRLDAVLNCGVSNLSLCDLYSMKEMSPDLDNHKLKTLTDGLTTPVTAVPFSVKPLDSVGIQSSFYLHNVVQDVEIEGHLAVPPAIVISQPSINDRSTSRASKKKQSRQSFHLVSNSRFISYVPSKSNSHCVGCFCLLSSCSK